MQIYPGLDKGNPQRNPQRLPEILGPSFDTGPCQPITLKKTTDRQAVQVDSRKPVSQLLIGVASAYQPAADAAPFLSITEVILKSYPDRL